MKFLKILLGFILVLAAAGLFARVFLKPHEAGGEKDKPDKKEEAEPSRVGHNKNGETVVKLDAETQQRLGLAVEPLAGTAGRTQVAAFGRVVDPTPLAAVESDLATAESALISSKSEAERLGSLFKSGENIARKNLETAHAQFRADEIRVQALRRRLALEWGESVAKLNAEALHALLDSLVGGRVAIVRVDVLPGDTLTRDPSAARVVVLGHDDQPLVAASIAPAVAIDPKTQAQGVLLQIENPPFPLRPGAAATAFLELPGDAQKGVVIPRATIVRHGGAAWVYVKTGDEKFVRREVTLSQPTGQGWCVSHGFEPGEKVVSTGAQAILSEELKAQFGGGE